ncbi:PhoH family protein [Acanthopleuribacter pedis]|uniref:PhoH family protein n=1 Tax=Acanthopleuribacter pedis TaxID=442870 RepID=A0A8J7Q5V6_9BACT|nr:PhoH family protein [Acanthopleuribacter pedis]MBO1318354.1 PhoH family protein [Acanthopleuribacter pedis]
MKTFVLDTTVLIHDPMAIYKFKENEVLVPLVVIEEIDKFKRDQSEVGRNARMVSRFLDKERAKGRLSDGVPLDEGGTLRAALESADVSLKSNTRNSSMNNDNWILGVAVHQMNHNPERTCILVTKDVNLRIKADALRVPAEDYSNDKVELNELYTGCSDLEVDAAAWEELSNTRSIEKPEEGSLNQFFIVSCPDVSEEPIPARLDPQTGRLSALPPVRDVWGVKPLNVEQRLAIELLLDQRIQLVSLVGKAGTGKTLIALAAGLQIVVDENKFHRLMVSRPIHPMGKDLGYLPGDIDEKIRPWMQPIFDNLEYILHCNSEDFGKGQVTYEYFIDKGWMVVEPLTYMRGRSIPNQYMLVDEAQNLTPHEIKSIITRAGHGTKIVLTGDPNQIDHPFLDASTNGISYLVNRFRNHPLYGHVTLTRGERSPLAEAASNLL